VQQSLLDAATFLRSLGGDAVTQFREELTHLHRRAEAAGLTAVIRATAEKQTSVEPEDDLVRRSVERLVIAGSGYFERALAGPGEMADEGAAEISFAQAFELAASGHTGAVEPARFSGVMVPLRENGWAPWITTWVRVGRDSDSPPFSDPYFVARFMKAAAVASQEGRWQDLRGALRIRAVDIDVGISPSEADANDPHVARRGSTIDVQVNFALPPLGPDLRVLGDALAQSVMETTYESLTR